MALDTTATLSADISFKQQDLNTNSTNNFQGNVGYSVALASGTGTLPKQIDSVYNLQEYVLASGATGTFNFQSLSQNIFNGTITLPMTGIKSLIIRNHNTGTNEYLLLAATGLQGFTNLFNGETGNVRVHPGGAYFYTDPYNGTAVTSANKYLHVMNAGPDHGNAAENTGIKITVVAVGITGIG